jgi:phosphoenolpyruvate carboxykinase (GTP)
MTVTNPALTAWVREMAQLTTPDRVTWLDGSDREYEGLLRDAVAAGQLIPLNPERHPGCYLHRSHPADVARTEQCTFICTPTSADAGPTNRWMAPEEAYAKLRALFDGAMRGRTMYVVPYLMGPKGSAFGRVGVQLTDSLYVAISMRIMTRMGAVALEHLGGSGGFVKGLHSVGTLNPEERYICHFPQDLTIYSINSGYGGNALLGKKCFALRLGSWLGRREGWLAEHMLIMGIEDPQGRITYIAAAFPSMCGKTNLAMLQPPARYKGWRIWCVGDDIAWLRPEPDGRLYAVNPEAGLFGVAPGTNWQTNPNMMSAIARNALFTNVALAPDRTVWWEGLPLPADTTGFLDWQGRPWSAQSGQQAAQANARFTVPITQCPVLSPAWHAPEGVPISAILFGARRSTTVPLVFEAFNWAHGVYLGATLASETTAAATGATGVLRREPMAMLPFCGYNMADYFSHWLNIGGRLTQPPKIFRVNWFRANRDGRFIWPGFGENLRVLQWIVDRCGEGAEAISTPLGWMPTLQSLNLDGLALANDDWAALMSVDRSGWMEELARQDEFFAMFGDRLPGALREEQAVFRRRLGAGPDQPQKGSTVCAGVE